MYLFIYLFIYIYIYNKGGKTHWRLAGRCPLGVSVCRRHWNCVSMASGYELTSKHTQNQFKKKKKTFRQAANAPQSLCQGHAGIGRIQYAGVHLNIFEQPPHISNSPCWSSSPCLGEPPPRTAEQARGTERR